MPVINSPRSSEITLVGTCVACPTELVYTLDTSHGSPEILAPLGAIAYRSGHLCPECVAKVERALAQ